LAIRLPTSPTFSPFTSPEDTARTVLAMCVFPSAGESAVFSNAIDYAPRDSTPQRTGALIAFT
jgi:hypothetical protein